MNMNENTNETINANETQSTNSKVKSNSKFNKIVMVPIVLIILVFLFISLSGQIAHWLNLSQKSNIPTSAILSTIESANTITVTGDLDNVNFNGFIEADAEFVGNLEKEGLWNTTYTFSSNGTELVTMPVGDPAVTEGATTMSYTALDANGNIMGYSENFLAPIHGGEETHAYFFFDENKNQMPYFHLKTLNVLVNDYEFLNFDGETVISIDYEVDYTNNVYEMYFTRHTDDIIPAQDILMLICEVEQELATELDHLIDNSI